MHSSPPLFGIVGTVGTFVSRVTESPAWVTWLVGSLTATYWLLKIVFLLIDRRSKKD